MTCAASIARFRRLKPAPYARAGAGYSALLFLPLVYLLVRMWFGRPIPKTLIVAVYALVYTIWLVVYLLAGNLAVLGALVADVIAIHDLDRYAALFFILVLIVILPVNLFTFVYSLQQLRQRHKMDREGGSSSSAETTLLLDWAYLMPFLWLIGWSLVIPLIVLMVSLSGFIGT